MPFLYAVTCRCFIPIIFFKAIKLLVFILIGSGSLLEFIFKLVMTICVVKPVILEMISFLKPKTILTVNNITDMPIVIPIIPIFTIGFEMLPLF